MRIVGAFSRRLRKQTPEWMARFLDDFDLWSRNVQEWRSQREIADSTRIDPATYSSLVEAWVHLRKWVGDWIVSGKAQGVDSPWERKPSLDALHELHAFAARARVVPEEDGRTTINLPIPEPGSLAHDAAVHLFQQLLDSPERERLSRCDECDSYFARKRMPKKDMAIKRGTFCARHKAEGSMKRTDATREDRRGEMVKLAAKCWVKYDRHKRREGRTEWLVQEMNKELRRWRTRRRDRRPWAADITKRWLTQNRAAIANEERALETQSTGGN
jgi:hypothetical protein